MLRNSTQKFREKYEGKGAPSYWSSDLLASRPRAGILSRKEAMNATCNRNVKDCSRSAKKLETPALSRANKARQMEIKSKETLESLSSSHLAHGRLEPANEPRQSDQQSETSISSIKWRLREEPSSRGRDPEGFIDSLPKNAVFYCCECFQYVFEIEKKRHFPDCRDRVDVSRLNRESYAPVGWERLEKLVELALYTGVKTWEVEQLYLQVLNHDFSKIYSISYPADPRFFSLDEIVCAFAFTYERFLRGSVFKQKSVFGCF